MTPDDATIRRSLLVGCALLVLVLVLVLLAVGAWRAARYRGPAPDTIGGQPPTDRARVA